MRINLLTTLGSASVAILMALLVYFVYALSAPLINTLPACAYEDGSNSPIPCKWNAETQGNGTGISYIISEAP